MSECGVCIDGGNYDYEIQFSTCTTPKARKPHRCCECERTILPGERYQRWTGFWDGSFDTNKSCLPCAEIRTAFTCEGGETVGTLWEDMDNVLPELTTANECFRKLSPASKEFLLAKWREWKGL